MLILLKLHGVFKSAVRSGKVQLNIPIDEPTVRAVIDELAAQPDFKELRELLLDAETLDPRPNALIMVSGREIGTLDGLDTKLKANDELSLLPIAHGG